MRLGIDARLVYHSKAGIGQYIIRLVQALAEVQARDAKFVLLQSRKDRTEIATSQSFSRVSLWTPVHHRFEQLRLQIEVFPLRLNLLHSPDFIPPFRRNCLSVITVHDLAFLLYPHFLTKGASQYYGQVDRAVRSADHIIAVSRSTKQDVIDHLGIPEEKITVIHEAPHPGHRRLDRDVALNYVAERLALDTDYILFVGTIEPRKNLVGLLRAFSLLRNEHGRKEVLVLAGSEGWLTDEVHATVDELSLRNEVIFLGRVSDDDLLHLYNAASLLVHPAFYEGFGLTTLEAMACGTPAVVSNTSAMPEVVGDAAVLIDPHDIEGLVAAMSRVLSDQDFRDNLVERGLKRAAGFTWRRTAEETMDVYRKVVGERGRARS